MMREIGAVLDGGPGGHAGAGRGGRARHPVRRGSRLVGTCEGAWWRRTDRAEVRRVLLAARRYDLAGRRPGRRNGPLGHVALEVLDLLANLVDRRTGRLDPSLAWLMGRLKRSKDAVVRALANLRTAGFLDWLRRYEPTGCEGRGPQVRQTSSAYRLSMPPRAARLLIGEPPLPDDVAQDLEDRRQDLAAVKAGLGLDELAVVEVDDGPLGRALASLGRHVQERESASRSEYKSTIYK
ncbi:helix-turn-helix domain-containing protein [Rubellimicrobium rubrum]|uniref:Helix-turn-helix domain-containing protein n=1 Tax=Rubellimicrobium rubrum TaxID=2585369 RepID=A0A5C4ML42_9RHOB|nr:helix-turn-helix domain-containing protein [Rubellimicrobium rubrum]TNC45263.1 helix-turn-helix domain-containing protein [Rubellimicrobium rubrum]